jgi:hypothetical protein
MKNNQEINQEITTIMIEMNDHLPSLEGNDYYDVNQLIDDWFNDDDEAEAMAFSDLYFHNPNTGNEEVNQLLNKLNDFLVPVIIKSAWEKAEQRMTCGYGDIYDRDVRWVANNRPDEFIDMIQEHQGNYQIRIDYSRWNRNQLNRLAETIKHLYSNRKSYWFCGYWEMLCEISNFIPVSGLIYELVRHNGGENVLQIEKIPTREDNLWIFKALYFSGIYHFQSSSIKMIGCYKSQKTFLLEQLERVYQRKGENDHIVINAIIDALGRTYNNKWYNQILMKIAGDKTIEDSSAYKALRQLSERWIFVDRSDELKSTLVSLQRFDGQMDFENGNFYSWKR